MPRNELGRSVSSVKGCLDTWVPIPLGSVVRELRSPLPGGLLRTSGRVRFRVRVRVRLTFSVRVSVRVRVRVTFMFRVRFLVFALVRVR